jgi:hypothetical protein
MQSVDGMSGKDIWYRIKEIRKGMLFMQTML